MPKDFISTESLFWSKN